MNQNLTDDFYALAALIPPEQLSRYLHAQGWDLVDSREGLLEEWAEPTVSNLDVGPEIYLLPINRNYRDFNRRFVEFLQSVADYYEISAHELSHRVRLGNADVLLFRISAERDTRDSVGLNEASGVLHAAHRMLTMSARYTSSPGKDFTGRMKPDAREYLTRHVALGHTQRGSFVFPILTGPRTGSGAEALFARKVAENLAIGLERLQSIAGNVHSAVSDELDPLVLALAGPLQQLSKIPRLQFIDISFRWAPGRGIPRRLSDREISLETASIRQIGLMRPRMREILQGAYDERFRDSASERIVERSAASAAPALAHAELTDVSGQIIALQIDDRRIQDWGTQYSIVIRSESRDAVQDVQIPVAEVDYERAAEARNHGITATATGRLFSFNGGHLLQGEVIFGGLPSR